MKNYLAIAGLCAMMTAFNASASEPWPFMAPAQNESAVTRSVNTCVDSGGRATLNKDESGYVRSVDCDRANGRTRFTDYGLFWKVSKVDMPKPDSRPNDVVHSGFFLTTTTRGPVETHDCTKYKPSNFGAMVLVECPPKK